MKKFLFTLLAMTPRFRVLFALGKTSLILICFLLIASCKKDQKKLEPNTEPTAQTTTTTIATLPDSIKIDSANSKIKITQVNSGPLYGATYFFDLDGDSINDFVINKNLYSWHNLPYKCSMELQTLNKDLYILADSVCQRTTYNCNTLLTVSNINMLSPRGLVFNDKISVNDKGWRKGNFTFFYFEQEMDTLPCHNRWYDGYWYQYTSPRYVALEFKGKLGWLKLRIDSGLFTLQFFEYALYKE